MKTIVFIFSMSCALNNDSGVANWQNALTGPGVNNFGVGILVRAELPLNDTQAGSVGRISTKVAPPPGVSSTATLPPDRWDARALDLAALYFNPSLAVARARWKTAEAAVTTTGKRSLRRAHARYLAEAGRELEGPMAIVILGGLLSSAALNLLILPGLALRFSRFGGS